MTNGEEGSQGAVESALVGREAMLGCGEKLLVLKVLIRFCFETREMGGPQKVPESDGRWCDLAGLETASRVCARSPQHHSQLAQRQRPGRPPGSGRSNPQSYARCQAATPQ